MDAKRTMGARTLLFIGKKYALAYDYSYYKKHYNDIHRLIAKAEKIYLKVNDDRKSWIKYKEAIQNLPGAYEKRIETALATPAYRLSTDLFEIPACYYTDADGYQHYIAPNDGKINPTYWLDRADIVQAPPTIELVVRGTEERPIYDVKATYKFSVKDAIFTLNTFFADYEYLTNEQVIFRDVGHLLTRIQPLENYDAAVTHYNADVAIYKWAGVKKLPTRKPEIIDDNALIFRNPVDANGMIFYNGVYYRHKVVDDLEDKGYGYKVRLIDIEPSQVSELILDDVNYVKFVSTDGTDNIKKYELKGINNLRPNEVEFPMVISNSMITASGLDHTYLMKDKYSIEYPIFDNGMGGDLEDNTPVFATCFYSGIEGMGAGLPSGYDPEDAYDIIGNLSCKVEKYANHKMNDYTDFVEFNEFSPNDFFLKYKPMQYTIRLIINGVRYEENVHFIFNKSENKVTWLFTEEVGGFELQSCYRIVVVYDFLFEENGILVGEIDNFMREYIKELTRLELGYE